MSITELLVLISSILIPIISFMGWTYVRLSKKIEDVGKDTKSIDQRLSKLEGAYIERGHWEGLYSMQKKLNELGK